MTNYLLTSLKHSKQQVDKKHNIGGALFYLTMNWMITTLEYSQHARTHTYIYGGGR
jgi:hypothetical protein